MKCQVREQAATQGQRDTSHPLPLLRTVLLDSSKELSIPHVSGHTSPLAFSWYCIIREMLHL